MTRTLNALSQEFLFLFATGLGSLKNVLRMMCMCVAPPGVQCVGNVRTMNGMLLLSAATSLWGRSESLDEVSGRGSRRNGMDGWIHEVGRGGRERTVNVKEYEKDYNFRKLSLACCTRLCSDL